MACKVACVITNVGAVPDYTIPGETAIVVPPKQPEKLAQGILYLLQDDRRRQRIAESGNKYIKRFSWNKATDQLENIFTKYI
jgi:glycosyltransferase involved in cell wall biosynthesis